jgi:peroxiredoxin
VAQLRRALPGYRQRPARYFAVTTGTPEHTRAFCARHEVPFPCLVDLPGEPGYAAFGLEKASLRRLFAPSLARGLWTVVRRAREVSIPKAGDVFQMSGTFVVDAAGTVRFAHRDRYPTDHPADETLWACLDRLVG